MAQAAYYEAVRAFFRRVKHEGNPLEVVFAGPDRAHNEMRRLLARRLETTEKRKLSQQEVEAIPTPVPFASLLIQPFRFDAGRFNPGSVRGLNKDVVRGTAQTMRLPRPVVSEVQLDLWCGSAGGEKIAMHIEPQVELQFPAESVYLPINWTLEKWYRPPFNMLEHFKAFGATRFGLITNGWTNTSDLEQGEGAKETRRSWTGTIQTALPHRPEDARLVRAVRFTIYDQSDTTTPLDEVVVGAED